MGIVRLRAHARWSVLAALHFVQCSDADLASPNFPPLYTANCSKREAAMLRGCRSAGVMCRGYGGTLQSCTHRNTTRGYAVEAGCDCFGRVAMYEFHSEVRADSTIPLDTCWVLDDCGDPPQRKGPECRPDVSGAACSSDDRSKCWYGSESGAYKSCLDAAGDSLNARCNCSSLYYACMRNVAMCEEFIAQQACDDVIDDYLAAGADQPACNYLMHCRCNVDAAHRSQGLSLAIAAASLLLCALLQ
eukprot:TRINITY_DN13054_c0_g1_i2.p1 TRINITY_DN13054_c0_g1~~TRINITY_DN13054_c0_g1_i2.p1  ORF type:complete len:246 (+),score=24.30 TRINITY_DN13054_c0_g1_i2:161-898(+)